MHARAVMGHLLPRSQRLRLRGLGSPRWAAVAHRPGRSHSPASRKVSGPGITHCWMEHLGARCGSPLAWPGPSIAE